MNIYDDIVKTLEGNGELDDKQYRRLVLFALVDLGRSRKELIKIREKVDRLENYSILLMAKKHPKIAAGVFIFFLLFTFSVIARLDLWFWLAEWIKILMS